MKYPTSKASIELDEVASLLLVDPERWGLKPGDRGAALLMASKLANDPGTTLADLTDQATDSREICALRADNPSLTFDQAVTTRFLRSDR